jgi:phytanoyl-CoA hydroxylase
MDTATATAQDYYEEHGYFLWRNLIPTEMVDRLVALYQRDIVPSRTPFVRQTSSIYEANEFTEHGFVRQSFLDIHNYRRYPEFSRCARDIYTSQAIRNALREITGFKAFNLMQTMLFDANTATQAHQDWWYLDSVPNGHLLAGWFALEDIDERAGRFYVLPGSHKLNLHADTPGLTHEAWIARVGEHVKRHAEQVFSPAMKKGDVLFWNSRTIHGSSPTLDPRFSRRSLTAHYLPSHLKFGNLFETKEDIEYQEYNGMPFFHLHPDYSLAIRLRSNMRQLAEKSPALADNLRKVRKLFGGARA